MRNNFIILLVILFLVSSCSGFKLKRSENADEFLIEKKNPLVMPPDIDQLPKPNEGIEEEKDNEFKEILKSKKQDSDNKSLAPDSNLTESIIKKIEE